MYGPIKEYVMHDWIGKSGYVAAGGLVGLANLTLNQWYMLIGMVVGIATLGINIYYKQKTKEHQDQMLEMRRQENQQSEEDTE